MRDALAETVDLLGPDRLLSTVPAAIDDTSAEPPSPADAPEARFGFIAPGD